MSLIERRSVVVIGGGFSGVCAAKCLREEGLAAEVLEQNSSIGGVWLNTDNNDGITNLGNRAWRSLYTTSSKRVTEFSDFPMPDSYPEFPTHRDMLAYLRAYADRFGVPIVTDCSVSSVRRCDGGYEVDTTRGMRRYAAAVLGTGVHQRPNRPDITGLGGFTGRVLHSSAYADPSSVGERVLIVGFGESGGDIAHELACAGRDVYLSVRNGVTLLERADLNGTPADFFTPRAKYLLPNAVQQGLDNWLVFGGQPFGHQIRAWRYPRRTNPWDTFFVKSSPLTPYLGSRVVPKPGVTAVGGASVHFTDGTRHDVDTILLCRGIVRRCRFWVDLSASTTASCTTRCFIRIGRTSRSSDS